jgi:hypothetical protein
LKINFPLVDLIYYYISRRMKKEIAKSIIQCNSNAIAAYLYEQLVNASAAQIIVAVDLRADKLLYQGRQQVIGQAD